MYSLKRFTRSTRSLKEGKRKDDCFLLCPLICSNECDFSQSTISTVLKLSERKKKVCQTVMPVQVRKCLEIAYTVFALGK